MALYDSSSFHDAVYSVLNPVDFEKWLSALSDIEFEDESRRLARCGSCPLARYLQASIEPGIEINSTSVWMSGTDLHTFTPDWAAQFISFYDRAVFSRPRPVHWTSLNAARMALAATLDNTARIA